MLTRCLSMKEELERFERELYAFGAQAFVDGELQEGNDVK